MMIYCPYHLTIWLLRCNSLVLEIEFILLSQLFRIEIKRNLGQFTLKFLKLNSQLLRKILKHVVRFSFTIKAKRAEARKLKTEISLPLKGSQIRNSQLDQ